MLTTPMTYGLRVFSKLWPPQKPMVFSGAGSIKELAELILASGSKRPLLVTGKYVLKSGQLDDFIQLLKDGDALVTIYNGSIPNPTFKEIEEGLSLSLSNHCDAVVAVGGGSVIDVAKVISGASTNQKPLKELSGTLKMKAFPLPFYAVPTTSGSGSEATIAAVISDTVTHKKSFFVDPKLVPLAVALDPELIKSLPAHMTAAVGMDALTHAVEAYTSLNRSADTDRHAEMAIQLIMEALETAVLEGDNLIARNHMAQASFYAGYAFTKSSLGYVHAISHQISAHYNTPHGLANAVLLPRILKLNKKVSEKRLASLEKMIDKETTLKGDEELAVAFIKRVENLSSAIGIPKGIEGMKASDYKKIAKDARKEAFSSYAVPKLLKQSQIEMVLESIGQA